jgi:hypothetical protein
MAAVASSGAALLAGEQQDAVATSETAQLDELRRATGAPALQAAVIVDGRIGWSTAATMAAKLVSAQQLDLMLTGMTTADGKPTGVGFGWRVVTNAGALEYAHHGGEAIGGRDFLLMIPKKRAAIAADKEALALLTPFLN